MPRYTAMRKQEGLAGEQKTRHYKLLSPRLIAQIFLHYKRTMTASELREILLKGCNEKGLEFPAMDYSIKQLRRYLKRMQKGAQIDHMGTLADLEKEIEQKRVEESSEGEARIAKRLKRKGETTTEEYSKGVSRTRDRLERVLGVHADAWSRDLIYYKIIDPMLHDKDPLVIDEEEFKRSGRRIQTLPFKLWSVKTINGIAGHARQIQPRLKDETEDEGALPARYEKKWTEIHGRDWQPPRTWLNRDEWELFGESLIKRNMERLAGSDYTLGQVMNLIARFQIATGFREKKEALRVSYARLVTGDKEDDWEISNWHCKKSEVWEHIPLHLFKGLSLRPWKNAPSLKEWIKSQQKRFAKETAKPDSDPTKDLRIFPIDYSIYQRAIAKARTNDKGEPIFLGVNKITGHSFRRTHATWLKMCGIPLEQIAGAYPIATLGIGWKNLDTLRFHYLGFLKKEGQKYRAKAFDFEVSDEDARRYEKEAGKLEGEEEEE